MAYGIASNDFVALCLVLAEGDSALCLEEVIQRGEAEQAHYASHFGVSERDFRMAFVWLAIESEVVSLLARDLDKKLEAAFQQPLREWIPRILFYSEIYFNDEAEHWIKATSVGSWITTASTPGLTEAALQAMSRATPRQVMAALGQLGWERATVSLYVESGVYDRFYRDSLFRGHH